IRMAIVDGLTAVGAVAQMTEIDFTQPRIHALQRLGILGHHAVAMQMLEVAMDAAPDPIQTVGARFADAVVIARALERTLLEHADAGAVLAAIALLFHQEVEL